MSKTDAIKAMKLARLEAQRAAAPAPAAVPAAVPRAAAPRASATTPAAAAAPSLDLVPEALCGHAAIGGKRCTRPQGHAEKNHRYAV